MADAAFVICCYTVGIGGIPSARRVAVCKIKEASMKCPNCGGRKAVEIDIHSEGFTAVDSPVKECGVCGLVWRIKMVDDKPVVDIITPGKKRSK